MRRFFALLAVAVFAVPPLLGQVMAPPTEGSNPCQECSVDWYGQTNECHTTDASFGDSQWYGCSGGGEWKCMWTGPGTFDCNWQPTCGQRCQWA